MVTVINVEHNGFQNRYPWEYSIPLLRYYCIYTNLILPQTSVDLFYRYGLKKKKEKKKKAPDIKNKILLRAYFDYSQWLL